VNPVIKQKSNQLLGRKFETHMLIEEKKMKDIKDLGNVASGYLR
jgi:hypothetical protein